MLRRTMFALALAAGLLSAGLGTGMLAAGLAAPGSRSQQATHTVLFAQTEQVHCEVSKGPAPLNPPYDYWIDAYATYDSVPGNPGFRQWESYTFRLDGLSPPGDQSNVNIRLFDGPVLIFEWHSPDNIHPRVWYVIFPGIHYTTTSAVDDVVSFEAIFDRTLHGDPRCTARTPAV
jgi:hypothetical protein